MIKNQVHLTWKVCLKSWEDFFLWVVSFTKSGEYSCMEPKLFKSNWKWGNNDRFHNCFVRLSSWRCRWASECGNPADGLHPITQVHEGSWQLLRQVNMGCIVFLCRLIFCFCFVLHIHNWMLFHTSFNIPPNIFPSSHGYWWNKISSCPSLGLFFIFSYGLFSNCLICEIADLSYFTVYIDILLVNSFVSVLQLLNQILGN